MSVKQVIVVRKDLNMRKGKIAAQVAHASMKFITDNYAPKDRIDILSTYLTDAEQTWLSNGFAKIVVSVDSEKELGDLISTARSAGIKVCPIIDSGKTEFHGISTLTCAAFGPDESEKLDPVTGELTLL